jgi:hypothetical protein
MSGDCVVMNAGLRVATAEPDCALCPFASLVSGCPEMTLVAALGVDRLGD